MSTFLNNTRVTQCANAAIAATSAVNGSVIDMSGFEEVAFVVTLGTAAANNGLKVQHGDLSDGSDMADLAGTSILSNRTCVVAGVVKPRKRYVRAVVLRGTSSTLDGLIALQSGPKTEPVTQPSTTGSEQNISPAAGTA